MSGRNLIKLLSGKKAVLRSNDGFAIAASYIAGSWETGRGGSFPVHNPTTNVVIGASHDCSRRQIARAFAAARLSQNHWHEHIGVLAKRDVLDVFAQLLEAYRSELTRLLCEEMGKTANTADADITETIHAAQRFRDILHTGLSGDFRDAQLSDKIAFSKRFPYGTILAIKPWNFLALSWWSSCAALAAGNAVVIKVSSETPFMVNATVAIFQEALQKVLGTEAEQCGDIVQVIHGHGSTTGMIIAKEGDYDMLAFTGGTATGKNLRVIAAQRNKRYHDELGGHAAIIVLDDFDLEKASNEIILGAFGDAGQRCVSTRVVFAQNTIAKQLLELVARKAENLRIGDPRNVATKVGPLISGDAIRRVIEQIEKTREQLGRPPVLGGYAINDQISRERALEESHVLGGELFKYASSGNFMVPTIFTDVPYGVCAMDEEIFGPVLCFNEVGGGTREDVLREAVRLVNQSRYGLSNSVLTWDVRLLFWAYEHMQTGIWYGGRGTTGAEVPGYFGGVKESGSGREAYGIEEYSWVKQGWLDLHPVTRLAQTGAIEKVKSGIESAESIFSD